MPENGTSPLSSRPFAADQERWFALLDLLDLDRLARDFLVRLEEVDEYAEKRVSGEELAAAARASFAGLIERMRVADSVKAQAAAFAVGTSRARAGISRAALMTAIRLDYVVLWNALVAVASEDDAQLLLRHADYVWQVVDEYAGHAQDGYLAERELQTDERQLLERALVSELVDTEERPPSERTAEIAAALGVPARAHWVVLAAEGTEAVALRQTLAGDPRMRESLLSSYRGATLLLLVTATAWHTRPALQSLRGSDLGAIVTVEGIEEVWAGARLASELAALPARNGGRRGFTDWPRLVRSQLTGTHFELVLDFEAKLAECSPAEREAIEESIRAYLETGSVQAAASQMFCHRNTITNRLRRFTELTGIDVTVPTEAASVVLAWA
ncbi:helix-turn-helix domain-containing protein [Leucobacter chromiireducens]|nr:helix-turn-helix domain-containing protein [Leucobacter chromiireducens]